MPPTLEKSFTRTTPDGDTHERDICDACGFVNYVNPKIVVGSVVTFEDKILLCRRAIEPRHGFWTVPAGYMEVGETPEEGALREAREEANALLTLHGLMACYTVRHLSQVQLIYRATLNGGLHAAGDETLETGLFTWDQIPWDDLAFQTVEWMLNDYQTWQAENISLPIARSTEHTVSQL
ncbi:MAG: NUDIX hydrolase [Pseudomonadota bacterium]